MPCMSCRAGKRARVKELPSPGGLYPHEYTIYLVDTDDAPRYWLHEGLSHECAYLWKLNDKTNVLRPYKTRCGIQVTQQLEKSTANLFNLVNVETTCIWCVSGKVRG